MSSLEANFNYLLEHGAELYSTTGEIKGAHLDIRHLEAPDAFWLAFNLTVRLAEMDDDAMYSNWTIEEAAWSVRGSDYIFPNSRPAHRNISIMVESWTRNRYRLAANVRNAFADLPEMEGGLLLQAGFITVLSEIELPAPDKVAELLQ